MQTWDDCIASLRAGADPEQVLPKVRALFEQLPSRPAQSPAQEDTGAEKPPTARLYHKLEGAGDTVFQLPYLRPPFLLWDSLRAASGEVPGEGSTLFDSELDVDLLGQFRPRFVDPPEEEVREVLRRQGERDEARAGPAGDVTLGSGGGCFEQEERERGDVDGGGESVRECSAADIDRLSDEVVASLSMENGSNFMEVGANAMRAFPPLTLEEWTLVFSRTDAACEICPKALTKFLLGVNQPSLSLLILHTVFPLLTADDRGSEDIEVFTNLVSTAASRAELDKLPISEVRALLDLYRGMDAGVLGALAQLRVVTNTGKGR